MSTDDQQKRGGLVPIGTVAVRWPGIEGRGRGTTSPPCARSISSSRRAKRSPISASWRGCWRCRTNPGDRKEYVRRNGPYTLGMTAGINNNLPYGNIPRLLLAWVCTEAVRTQRRELVLGRSLYEFMRKLGMENRSGGINGERTRLKNQIRRLFRCSVQLVYADANAERFVSSQIADRGEFWWSARQPDAPALWDSTIRLGEEFFNEIVAHPIPLDMNILKSLKRSPLGLDLYFWLVYRTFTLKAPLTLSWRQLYRRSARTRQRLAI